MQKRQLSILISSIFICIGASLFAQESSQKKISFASFHLELTPYTQFVYGNQTEAVYYNDRLLSKLVWDEKPLYVGGMNIKTGYKNLFVSSSLQSALPLECGTMADSDWLNVSSFPSCSDEIAAIKTNYSESVNTLDVYYDIQTQLGYSFVLSPEFSLSPFAEFDFAYYSFYAMGCTGSYYDTKYTESNGYYGSYDDAEHSYTPYYDTSTKVIQLQRYTYITWAGSSCSLKPNEQIQLSLSFAICPFIYVQSLDSHFIRNYYFYDQMSGYFSGIKGAFACNYAITKKQIVGITVGGTLISEITGTESTRVGTTGYFYIDSSETSSCSFTTFFTTLSYTYRFN